MICAPLLDHLIRPLQERRRDRQAEGLGGLEVDDELELGGLLDGKISWLGASENLIQIGGSPSRHLREIDSIAHETTLLNVQVVLIDCDDPMRGRKIDNVPSMRKHKGCRHHQDAVVAILYHPAESGGEFPRSVQDEGMKFDAEGPSRERGLLIVLSAQLGDFRERNVFLKDRDLWKIRYKRFEKLETLRDEVIAERLHAGDIATWPREAVDESRRDEINAGGRDNDGDSFRFQLE